jgi:hypothetical protein
MPAMSFLDRARQAAEQAAKAATDSAHTVADRARAEAPGAADRAKAMAGRAKNSLVTAVERIDPRLLADIVIKATALQERTNLALRDKGSAYRIAEITITATIPPQIGFTISRIGDVEPLAPTGPTIDSTTLVAEGAVNTAEEVDLEAEPPA